MNTCRGPCSVAHTSSISCCCRRLLGEGQDDKEADLLLLSSVGNDYLGDRLLLIAPQPRQGGSNASTWKSGLHLIDLVPKFFHCIIEVYNTPCRLKCRHMYLVAWLSCWEHWCKFSVLVWLMVLFMCRIILFLLLTSVCGFSMLIKQLLDVRYNPLQRPFGPWIWSIMPLN
jgi:hypothetical protein